MKYITIDDFESADENVKKEILKWWKPQEGDLVIDTLTGATYCLQWDVKEEAINDFQEEHIPLLTVGQLIDFIQDTDGCKLKIAYDFDDIYFTELIISDECIKNGFTFSHYELLEGLWIMAQEIIPKSFELL